MILMGTGSQVVKVPRPLTPDEQAEFVAEQFHMAYETLAPEHGWETQRASRKPWVDVPLANRSLMIAVADDLLQRGIIECNATTVDNGDE